MTTKQKRLLSQAGRAVFYAALTFSVAVYLVARYEEWFHRVNWAMVSVVCGFAFGLYMFYRWNQDSRNTFDPLDMFLDPFTRRVSPWRTVTLSFAGVGLWTLVQWVIKDKPAADIINLFTVLLTAFVAKLIGGDVADAYARRNPSIACDPNSPQEKSP